MSDDEKGSEKVPPARAGTAKAEARAERQARLAAALRQNLRRRKAQGREMRESDEQGLSKDDAAS